MAELPVPGSKEYLASRPANLDPASDVSQVTRAERESRSRWDREQSSQTPAGGSGSGRKHQSEQEAVDPEVLSKQLEELNAKVKARGVRLDLKSTPEGLVVEVIETGSGKLLRTIYSSEFPSLQQRIKSEAGLIVDSQL